MNAGKADRAARQIVERLSSLGDLKFIRDSGEGEPRWIAVENDIGERAYIFGPVVQIVPFIESGSDTDERAKMNDAALAAMAVDQVYRGIPSVVPEPPLPSIVVNSDDAMESLIEALHDAANDGEGHFYPNSLRQALRDQNIGVIEVAPLPDQREVDHTGDYVDARRGHAGLQSVRMADAMFRTDGDPRVDPHGVGGIPKPKTLGGK